MDHSDSWYHLENTAQLDTPALVIYTERVSENIQHLISRIDDLTRLRPHVKTHKSANATRLLMQAGIQKFKCATIAEAEMLGQCKVADVLLAYQPVGPKIDRFIALAARYPDTHFSCLVDHIHSAEALSEKAVMMGVNIRVFLDLNIGMNRTGIMPGKEAIDLYEYCIALPGLQPLGVHAYDGHIHESDIEKRRKLCELAFAPVESMMIILEEKGYTNLKIIAGGTPTFPFYAQKKEIECSPGTFIYWDKGYQNSYKEQHFLPAALVLSRVISRPTPSTLCLDMGYKAIASENELSRRITFLNAPDVQIFSHSEEHMVVEVGAGHSWQIGDVFYGLPIHVCPTIALYARAITAQNGTLIGQWEIEARDRWISV